LLEAFFQAPLNGAQWRILLWVIRPTYGWHQSAAPFSWYRIAKDISMDRGGVVRAGARLISSGILRTDGNEIGILEDPRQWKCFKLAPQVEGAMMGVSDDGEHLKAMTSVSARDDARHRERCQESALLRRAKESSKERKRYKEKCPAKTDDGPQRFQNGALSEHHPAGAARPIPGKYDGLSQN